MVFGGTLAVTLAGSCKSDAEDLARALGEGCLLDSDCDDALICVFRRCHVQCETSADCPPESRCIVGEPPRNVCAIEVQCTLNSDCAEGQVCGPDRVCRDECLANKDCPAAQSCVQHVCADSDELVNGVLPRPDGETGEGQPCTVNSECEAPLLCLNGTCRLQCQTDADCPGGVCVDNACEIPPPPPPECVQGQQGACTCVDGAAGVRVCGPDQMWGACDCNGATGGMGGMGGSGGVGGIGGMGGMGGGGPTVVGTTPLAGATNTEPNAQITLQLSGPVDVPTVTSANFYIEIDGVQPSGQFPMLLTTDTVELGMPNLVPLNTMITANYTGGLTVGGQGIAPGSWSFGVRQGIWTNVPIDVPANIATHPGLAVNASGAGFVSYSDGNFVQVAPFDFTNGPGTPATAHMGGGPSPPIVARANDGTGMLVVEDGVDIYTAPFDGTSWGLDSILDTQAADANDPALAMDHLGNMMAVWRQSDGTNVRVWASRYPVANMWTTPTIVDTLVGDDVEQVAITPDGVDSYTIIYRSLGHGVFRRSYAGGWGATQQLKAPGGDVVRTVMAAGSPATASAVVSWVQADMNDGFRIWTSRWSLGVWGASEFIDDGAITGGPDGVEIAIDAAGVVAAVFIDDNASMDVYGVVNRPGQGWDAGPTGLSLGGFEPTLAFQPSGDLVVAFTSSLGRATAEIHPDAVLSPVAMENTFDPVALNTANATTLVVDAIGRTLIAWRDDLGMTINIRTDQLE
jgi:Bacterial Ig-like domain